MTSPTKQALFGTTALVFALILSPLKSAGSELTAVAEAVTAAKLADIAVDAGKAIRIQDIPGLSGSIAGLRMQDLPFEGVLRQVKAELHNAPGLISHGLSDAEFDDLAKQILLPANATMDLEPLLQKYMTQRYFQLARSDRGVIIKTTDGVMDRMVTALKARGVQAEIGTVNVYGYRARELTVTIQGDNQAMIALQELGKEHVNIDTVIPGSYAEQLAAIRAEELQRQLAQMRETERRLAELDGIDAKLSGIRVTDQGAKPTADLGGLLDMSGAVKPGTAGSSR